MPCCASTHSFPDDRRGLRFKSGLDCGDVLARVHTTTGRMTYRGRVMNRAARIAGLATAGQVGGFKCV